jgi:signal transduction histidine kinase
VAGVAAGLGARLGVDPVLIRIGFAVLAFAGGAGVLLYALAWALVPAAPSGAPRRRRPATTQQGVALALITLGVLLLFRAVGLWFGDALVFPLILAAAGSAVLWWRSDEQQRASWQRAATPRGHVEDTSAPGVFASATSVPVSPIRIVVGTLLVAGAVAGFVAANEAFAAAQDLLVAVVAAIAGVALLFGPWLWRVLDQLGTERRARIRQEERAEVAAHLHDSVLQTLALIQRSSDQPRRMVALARRQERELRSWLYASGVDAGPATSLEQAVTEVGDEIEAVHGLTVELVVVGDLPLDEHLRALIAAMREACVNAAKHAGVDRIDGYVEVDHDEVVAYVRDRGVGFDPATVPQDRQGIAGSIVDRLERHGGSAVVHSTTGGGTEVELRLPLRPLERP